MKKVPLNVLIVGVGIVGERHLRAQVKFGHNVGIFERSIEKAKVIGDKFQVRVFSTIEEGLVWCNLVHICTPDDFHTEIAAKAIRLKKTVLCEKPVTTNLKDALYLQSLVNQYQTYFFVGNNNRLIPTFGEIKKRVKKEKLGKLLTVHTTYLHDMRSYQKRTPWRLGQNFLFGGAIHAIDLLLWIVNEPVASVAAQTGRKLISSYTQPEDYHITFTFKSGLVGTVWSSARVVLPIHKVDVEVYGERGTYLANNKSGVLQIFQQGNNAHDFINQKFTIGYRYTIPKEIEIVNRYLQGKKKEHTPVPTIDEVIPLMKVMDAIEQSIKVKKSVEVILD